MAVAPQQLPLLPPEGIAPVTDPASTGTAPDASPTTMVLQYLKSRGFQPSSENVRRALEANQRDPGVIPGLRSDRPATDAEDQAAMAAARGGSVGGGAGGGGLVREGGSWDTSSGSPNTSAAPSAANTGAAGGSGIGPLGMSIAAGIPAAALMYGASRIPARPGDTAPTVGASVPPPIDPGAGVVPPPARPGELPPTGGPGDVLPPGARPGEVPPLGGQTPPAARPGELPPDLGLLPGVNSVAPGVATMPPRGPTDMAPIPFSSSSPRIAPTTSTTLRTPPPRVLPRFIVRG